MVDPTIMCRQHLLGEHRELHALRGCLQQGISLDGYLRYGVLQMNSLWTRHTALVNEMEARGYNHKSPLEGRETLPPGTSLMGVVTDERGLHVLLSRCGRCWSRGKAREMGISDQAVLAEWEKAGAEPLTAKRIREGLYVRPPMNVG